MTDYLDLALKYGGFTSLDKVYLSQKLSSLSEEEKLTFITPPPSVINAYFAEIYQKQGPQVATDYYFNLSCQLKLYIDKPSFAEEKPFVRLNLSGKAFGFSYVSDEEIAQVFSQTEEAVSPDLLFEIAQVFPQYKVFVEEEKIFMQPVEVEEEFVRLEQSDFLLTEIAESVNFIKISGFNQEEVLQASQAYQGKRFYAWSGRSAILYIKK